MRILLSGTLLLALSSTAHAQPTLRREMARASFLVGTWEGSAWVKYAPEGERREARVTAEGQPILMGLALGWKSTSRAVDRSTDVVSDVDLSLRFHRDSSAFRASTTLPGHPRADGWARVAECELAWGYQVPDAAPGGDRFRYTLRVDAENRLTEVGERSSDDGRTWWQFYGAEMTGPPGGGCRAAPAAADSAGR